NVVAHVSLPNSRVKSQGFLHAAKTACHCKRRSGNWPPLFLHYLWEKPRLVVLRIRLLVGAIVGASLAPSAYATTFDYVAFVGAAKVGEAQITVERQADRYAISGEARAVGFMDFLTQWHSLFSASGTVDDGHPIVREFSLIERARNKIKEIFLANGKITYTKNGRTREPRLPEN